MRSSNTEIQEVAELLAKRAAVVRMIPPTQMKKQAVDRPEANWLTHLGRTLTKVAETEAPAPAPTPAAKLPGVPEKGWLDRLGEQSPWTTGLIGGLGGAAVGGLGGLLATKEEDEENKWRNAITGALAGGALGGGLGAAGPALGKLNWSRRLEAAAEENAKNLNKPGVLNQATMHAGKQLLSPPVLSAGAFQAHRHGLIFPTGPGPHAGKWYGSGLASPEAVFAEARDGPGDPRATAGARARAQDARAYVEKATGKSFTVGISPTLEDFEKKIKPGKEPTKFTRHTPGGLPYLRKETWLGRKALGMDPYYVTGRFGARARGAVGTAAAFLAPYLAMKLGRKIMPSQATQIAERIAAQRREAAGF